MSMKCPRINEVLFKSRKSIDWDNVESYLKRYQGDTYIVEEYGDIIQINYTTIDEYTGSKYTRGLHGAAAKAKANLVQILPELIEMCGNRRWNENKSDKHGNNAKNGWYRYDAEFEMPVVENGIVRWNRYNCTVLVMINDRGLYLYDVINIKKEARNPR